MPLDISDKLADLVRELVKELIPRSDRYQEREDKRLALEIAKEARLLARFELDRDSARKKEEAAEVKFTI